MHVKDIPEVLSRKFKEDLHELGDRFKKELED